MQRCMGALSHPCDRIGSLSIAMKITKLTLVLAGLCISAFATDVTIPLSGTDAVVKKDARYECDANAAALGLPKGSFEVQYFNGAGNSLAVLPIGGRSLIFANVISASGARYASAFHE